MRNSDKFVGSNGKVLFSFEVVDQLLSGTPSIPLIIEEDTSLSFAQIGDVFYNISANNTAILNIDLPTTCQMQKMTVVVTINSYNTIVSFSSNILWNQGEKPYLSSIVGSYSMIELIYDGKNKIYGRVIASGKHY